MYGMYTNFLLQQDENNWENIESNEINENIEKNKGGENVAKENKLPLSRVCGHE